MTNLFASSRRLGSLERLCRELGAKTVGQVVGRLQCIGRDLTLFVFLDGLVDDRLEGRFLPRRSLLQSSADGHLVTDLIWLSTIVTPAAAFRNTISRITSASMGAVANLKAMLEILGSVICVIAALSASPISMSRAVGLSRIRETIFSFWARLFARVFATP